MTTPHIKNHGTWPKLKLKANLHHKILWLKSEGMKICNKQNNKLVLKKGDIERINENTGKKKGILEDYLPL